MGCKPTTAESPSGVLVTSPTLPNTPVYVKSALKNSRANGKGKTEKPSLLKHKPSTLNKSVNFDEKVRVKLRTPTPSLTRFRSASSTQIGTQKTSNDNDDDDDDNQFSSVSSEEDIHNEQIQVSSSSSTPSSQRNQPNGVWYKNNFVGVVSSTNNIKEKNQQPPVIMTTDPTENINVPAGTRFRVLRKVQHSALPETSNPIDPNESSPTAPTYRPTVQSPPPPVQRPLSNTNAVLIEHRLPFPNGKPSSQPAYYAFSRRPTDKTISTEK